MSRHHFLATRTEARTTLLWFGLKLRYWNCHPKIRSSLCHWVHWIGILFVWQIKVKLEFPNTRNQCLTPMNQLLVALIFYATGSFQLVVGDTFAISKSTVCHTVHRVTDAIASLRDRYVKFPSTVDEQRSTMQSFYNRSKTPGIIGAIDCTHVAIQSQGQMMQRSTEIAKTFSR